ncbi:unnamed protein product, partial [Rotaria sordida]
MIPSLISDTYSDTTADADVNERLVKSESAEDATASQNVVPDNVNPTSNDDDLDCVKIEKRSILHTQLRKLGIQIEYAGTTFCDAV